MFFTPPAEGINNLQTFSDTPEIEPIAIRRMVQSFGDHIRKEASDIGIDEVYYLDINSLSMGSSGLVLKLKNRIELDIHSESGFTTAKRWNVSVPTNDVWDFPRILARKFLELHSRASSNKLSPEEFVQYNAILGEVYWAQYLLDRARPHYVEGTLIQKSPLRVRWVDGVTCELPWPMAKDFFLFESGDKFSALVKLGKENLPLSIENLNLIS